MRLPAINQLKRVLEEDGWELCFSYKTNDRVLHYYSKGRLTAIAEEDDQEAQVYIGCPFPSMKRVMQWLENVVGATRDMITL